MKRIFIFIATVLLTISISAATYYAAPNGIGDGSSYFSPTTFAKGVAMLQNGGDTLYLCEGTYEFSDKFSINKRGSASKRIVISGYPGDEVLLDFRCTSISKTLRLLGRARITSIAKVPIACSRTLTSTVLRTPDVR